MNSTAPTPAPERWQEIQRIFQAVVECPADQRAQRLEQECGGDPQLFREVAGLLQSDSEAGGFIEEAVAAGADLVASELLPTEVLPATDSGRTAPTAASGALVDAGATPELDRFGKYEVLSRVGQGGFGVVYKGRDSVLQRTVAIKTCSTLDEGLRQRFSREGRIAAQLQHPNITTVHDFGAEGEIPYLVQEFLTGEDLDTVIASGRELDLPTKLDILLQIARGLEYAHQAGVLHRDIKPANVRILANGGVKLMDFGIARLLTASTALTATGVTLGTVGYLAPEQLRSEELDERADVFAFGVLAYELLTDRRPFQGEDFSQVSYQLLYVDPPDVQTLLPECPPPLAAVVGRCLEKERLERYPGFTPVLADLETLDEQLRTGVPPALEGTAWTPLPAAEAGSGPTGSPIRRRWPAVAGLVLAVTGAAWWWARSGDGDAGSPSVSETRAAALAELRPGSEIDAGQSRPGQSPPEGDSGAGETGRAPEDPSAAVAASGDVEIDSPEPTLAPPEARTAPPRSAAVERSSGAPPAPADTLPSPSARDDGRPAPSSPRPSDPAELEVPSAAPAPSAPTEVPATAELSVEPRSNPSSPPAASPPARESSFQRGDLIKPGPGVVPPRLLERPEPQYPRRARLRNKGARIKVRVLVDETGRVLRAVVARRDPFGLHEAARRAALQARYEPATRDGIAGKMWTELLFAFRSN